MSHAKILTVGSVGGLAPSRRALLSAPLLLAPTVAAPRASGAPVEIHMRLKKSTASRLTVALTLDACPGGFDQRIVVALAAMRVPATIFVSGAWLERNAEGWAFLRGRQDLFDLENHGARHIPPVLGGRSIFGLRGSADLAAVRQEVAGGADAIVLRGGRAPTWYRGAAGYYSPTALPMIRSMGFAVAGFSLNGDVGASLSAQATARRIAAAVDGDVIVAHVNQPRRASGQGVVAGVAALERRGARFMRLSEVTPLEVEYGPI